jgi:hypothetical protein
VTRLLDGRRHLERFAMEPIWARALRQDSYAENGPVLSYKDGPFGYAIRVR